VLHVVDNFFPASGGLERAVAALCRRWLEIGVEPLVVTGWRSGLARRETVAGVEVVRIQPTVARLPGGGRDPDRVFFAPTPDLLAARQVADVVAEFSPDVVHGHGWMLDAVASAVTHLPVVAGWHDFSATCARKSMVRDGVTPCAGPSLSACMPCAAGQYGPLRAPLVVVSLAAQQYRRSHGVARPAAQVAISQQVADTLDRRAGEPTVVPTFVDDELLTRAQAAVRPSFVPSERPYIVYAGQLAAHKGVKQLLAAHDRLVGDGRDVALALLGLPMPGFDLAPLVTARQAPLVIHRDRVAHGEVLGAMRHATVGVAPSLQEALGQVAVEMLAAGCPAVVSHGTGLAEVVGDAGVLVSPGDVAGLTAELGRLLDDPAEQARLRTGGPQRAVAFTLSQVLPRLLSVYDRVLGEPFLTPVGQR
jgi:glycosyltransferase involved in cell wall biosynthesis